jgi:hypothetical protein
MKFQVGDRVKWADGGSFVSGTTTIDTIATVFEVTDEGIRVTTNDLDKPYDAHKSWGSPAYKFVLVVAAPRYDNDEFAEAVKNWKEKLG